MVRRKAQDATRSSQFNPHNGEPHTKKWLDLQRAAGLRRKR